MKSFVVSFHQADHVDTMQIQKLNQEDFDKATAGGTRNLFELDTNIGLFVFFDAEDADGVVSYLMLQYVEDSEDPVGCYSFKLEDFYEFMALYLSDLELIEEVEDDEEEVEAEEQEEQEQEYGPIHHLAHLLFHIVDEGQDLEV